MALYYRNRVKPWSCGRLSHFYFVLECEFILLHLWWKAGNATPGTEVPRSPYMHFVVIHLPSHCVSFKYVSASDLEEK